MSDYIQMSIGISLSILRSVVVERDIFFTLQYGEILYSSITEGIFAQITFCSI